MSLSCGFVGLPNVGKSTIFNAILKKAVAAAENYPFCTIEPNKGSVPVEDARLEVLAKISETEKIVPALLECVDIAGLVKDASKGEGLGNQFLGHIRECDLIVQVLRCFVDSNIIHVEGSVDPLRDYEIISLELQLADLEKLEKIQKSKKISDAEKKLATVAYGHLSSGNFLNTKIWESEFIEFFNMQGLITHKPMLCIANMADVADEIHYKKIEHLKPIKVFANIEVLLQDVNLNEREEFLKSFNLEESGLSKFVQIAYQKLGWISFFTTGKKETRAWRVRNSATMQEAAGVIHTDFAKHFISADVVEYKDFVENNGWNGAKEKGLVKKAAKEAIVKDGDICIFKSYK